MRLEFIYFHVFIGEQRQHGISKAWILQLLCCTKQVMQKWGLKFSPVTSMWFTMLQVFWGFFLNTTEGQENTFSVMLKAQKDIGPYS